MVTRLSLSTTSRMLAETAWSVPSGLNSTEIMLGTASTSALATYVATAFVPERVVRQPPRGAHRP